jgi:hypothetical protein
VSHSTMGCDRSRSNGKDSRERLAPDYRLRLRSAVRSSLLGARAQLAFLYRDRAEVERQKAVAPIVGRMARANGRAANGASVLSIGSRGSVLSINSVGSVLSVGSVGSVLSIGSIGSAGSILSIGSFASLAGILSAASVVSLLSWRSVRSVLSGRRTAGR